MSITAYPVNKALQRPLLIAGVEKKLVLVNAMLCFPMVAATHLRFPSCLFGIVLFALIHTGLTVVSKDDPYFGTLIKRASRYYWNPYFLAKSHPLQLNTLTVDSVGAH